MSAYECMTGWIPARFVFAFLVFWACLQLCILQMSLNLTIVAMVNQTAVQTSTRTSKQCYLENNQSDSDVVEDVFQEEEGEFAWGPSIQGLLLGGMFFGYVASHALGGVLAQRYGCKRLVLFAVLTASVLALVIPIATRAGGAPVLFALRIAQGAAMGIIVPTLYSMVARWSPVLERSIFTSLSFSGSALGCCFIVVTAGYVTSQDLLNGWTHVFYLSGATGCLFSLVWYLLAHDTPDAHPNISSDEFLYITQSLNKEDSISTERKSIPWKSVAFSRPFWSLLVIRCTSSWGVFTIQTATPLYLQTALNVPLQLNGIVNGMIYLVSAVCSVFSSVLADAVRKRTKVRTTIVRKTACTIAYVGSAACWLSLTGTGCNVILAFFVIVAAKFFGAMSTAGDYVVVVDMAPQFAGPLSGLVYTLADAMGFLCPLVTGIITANDVTTDRWNHVFGLCATLLLLGLVQFLFLGSAELQPWAKGQEAASRKRTCSESRPLVEEDTLRYDSLSTDVK